MGGFCFTDGGLSHAITETDVEAISTPPFAPMDATHTDVIRAP